MTDSNKQLAEAEMKQVIREACEKQTLWTIDWDNLQLQRYALPGWHQTRLNASSTSLQPKPLMLPKSFTSPLSPPSGVKRKRCELLPYLSTFSTFPCSEAPPQVSKKAKRSALGKSAHAVDMSDQVTLNRRAQRFQREHEMERTKLAVSTGWGPTPSQYSSYYGPAVPDAMEVDPVRLGLFNAALLFDSPA
jgi:hypothetical protein